MDVACKPQVFRIPCTTRNVNMLESRPAESVSFVLFNAHRDPRFRLRCYQFLTIQKAMDHFSMMFP